MEQGRKQSHRQIICWRTGLGNIQGRRENIQGRFWPVEEFGGEITSLSTWKGRQWAGEGKKIFFIALSGAEAALSLTVKQVKFHVFFSPEATGDPPPPCCSPAHSIPNLPGCPSSLSICSLEDKNLVSPIK